MDTLVKVARVVDRVLGSCGLRPRLLARVDAWAEMRAIYALTNFIDAHTFAQQQLSYMLGE